MLLFFANSSSVEISFETPKTECFIYDAEWNPPIIFDLPTTTMECTADAGAVAQIEFNTPVTTMGSLAIKICAQTVRSVVIDINGNWGDNQFVALRAIDFLYQNLKITNINEDDFIAYSTSHYNYATTAANVFDTSLSKIDGIVDTEWLSSNGITTNQRLICVFNENKIIDCLKITNSHEDGFFTDKGIKNVRIHFSADEITNIDYSAQVPNSVIIFDGIINEHIEDNVEDEQILSVCELQDRTANIVFDIPETLCEINEFAWIDPAASIEFSTPTSSCEIYEDEWCPDTVDMIFDSPVTTIIFSGDESIEFDLPTTTMECVAYTDIVASMVWKTPKTTVFSAADTAIVVELVFDIPKSIVEMHTEAFLSGVIGKTIMVATAVNSAVVSMSLALPKTIMVSNAINQNIVDITFDVPASVMDAPSINGVLVDITGFTPSCLYQMTAVNGPVATIAAITPKVGFFIECFNEVVGELVFVTPRTTIISDINKHTDAVLRHVRGAIR